MDKLFLEVAGCPVVAHTWQRFNDAECIDEIVLVVRDGMQPAFRQVPPNTPRSTIATSSPSNSSVRIELPEPVPMMTRSKWRMGAG